MITATGVGSMPGTDVREAIRTVWGELPELPFLPELPGRGVTASMIGRTTAVITDLGFDLQPAGWRLTNAPGIDHRRAMSLLAQDLDALEELTQGYTGPLKLQLTGPLTMAAALERPRGDKVLGDIGARRDLAQALGEGIRRHLADVQRRVPGASLVLQLDEPALPAVLAGQALTASAASGGRLTLGIGLSHQMVIEGMYGYSFAKPVRHMREYLTALVPLCSGEPVDFEGETLTAKIGLAVPDAPPVPVLVAALGPKMLELAAQRTAGTVTWMTGPRTLAEHTVPTITAAAEAAGTGDMRVVGALPVAVTDDPDAVRARAAKTFAVYGMLPSYRAMLDREGAA